MNRKVILTLACLVHLTSTIELTAQQLPAPRAPKRVRITQVEQLLPNARIVVQRPFKWIVGAQWGLGLQEGEKLLIIGSRMHPLVVRALALAAQEMGVRTDVFTQEPASLEALAGREEFDYERFDPTRYMVATGAVRSRAAPEWLARMADDYDIVVGFNARGTTYGKFGKNRQVRSTSMDYLTPEQLASPSVSYPDELHEIITMRIWQKLIAGQSFHIYDPRGTDLTFTLDDTNLERFKETRGQVTYGEATLEWPLAHEISLQVEPNLNLKPDARGVIVSHQAGYMPQPIRIQFEGGQIVNVEGGGQVGENIREALEGVKEVQYPGYYPGPGMGWLEELALGTDPKVGPAGPLRRRSGMVQLAFGTDRYNLVRDTEPTLPTHHRDIDCFYYVTVEIDGEKLVDRGRLTVLDDVEVRRVASRFGDPDSLLQEDWIPDFDADTERINYPSFE